MSESVHTPGPWSVDGDPSAIWVTGPDRSAAVICDIEFRKYGHPATEEDRANADLIAAAPDLLEMAETHEQAHQHCVACPDCFRGRHCGDGKALITRVYALRVLALAKVRGEDVDLGESDLPATANDKG